MRALFVADDQFIPTNDGGRLANRNDAAALVAAGFDLTVLVIHERPITADAMRQHEAVARRVFFAQQRPKLRSTATNPLLPFVSSARLPKRAEFADIVQQLAQQPAFDVIVAAHEYTLPLAKRLARRFGTKLVLRSHNDEIAYNLGMIPHSPRARRKLWLWLEAKRLSLGLGRMLDGVATVALISPADAPPYVRRNARTVVVSPTLSPSVRSDVDTPGFSARETRIAFVGALEAPHTGAGLVWFVHEVFPHIRDQCSEAEFVVLGRGMTPQLREELTTVPGVAVAGEVPELESHLDAARVFVNPIAEGSGVNMKLGPPAAAGLPIVSTTFGIRGLPYLDGPVVTADSPADFAHECLHLLTDADHWQRHSQRVRDAVRDNYSAGAVAAAWRSLADSLALG